MLQQKKKLNHIRNDFIFLEHLIVFLFEDVLNGFYCSLIYT